MAPEGRGGRSGKAAAGGDKARSLRRPERRFRAIARHITRDRRKQVWARQLTGALRRSTLTGTFRYQFNAFLGAPCQSLPPKMWPATLGMNKHGAPGLAAMKHEQRQQAQEKQREEFRFNASVKRKARRPVIENKSLEEPKSREELRQAARLRAISAARLRPLSLQELCELHLRNGTLDQFLKSLKPG